MRRQRDTDSVINGMRRASSHEERVPTNTNTGRCRMLNYSRQGTWFQIQKGLHCPWCSVSSLGTGGKHLNTMTLPCPILEYVIVKNIRYKLSKKYVWRFLKVNSCILSASIFSVKLIPKLFSCMTQFLHQSPKGLRA